MLTSLIVLLLVLLLFVAVIWYGKAEEQRDVATQYELGLMNEKIEKVQQMSLGGMYYKGEEVQQDCKEALKWCKWYKKAAEQGHAEA